MREIASGGMGVVYAAHDPTFDRELAIKVMSPDQDAARFVLEAKVTARLPHPGVPPVYDLGTLPDGRPYLTMKLIRGRTLADELKAARPDLPRLLDVFERICLTVGFAHSKGIVHRDLKPSNVMVGNFGEVQVMDWGLAKELRNADCGMQIEDGPTASGSSNSQSAIRDPQFPETVAGEVKGTPAYMAPEQARGEPVDARADVFALGSILAVILTGKPPFSGDTVRDIVLRAARADLGACFSALSACGADPGLLSVAQRCLAPDPAGRFASGEDVAEAVAAYRAGVTERLRTAERDRAAAEARATEEKNTRREVEARIGAERAHAAAERKRRRAQLVVAAAVLALWAGGAAFVWWQDKQTAERRLLSERTEAEWQLTNERARAESERVRADTARMAGELDAEKRNKVEQARQGVRSGLVLATDLRKQFRFKQADSALAQALTLTRGGAPELADEVERARRDLVLVVALDGIRYRKWVWITEGGGRGRLNTKSAPPAYRRTFAEHGLDLTSLPPADAARRLVASAVCAELVTAVDDWALYEPDTDLRDHLLEIARTADPGPWTGRLRDPAVWRDRRALVQLAGSADPATIPPALLGVLTELMKRNRLNPVPFLLAARTRYPADFELAFALGQWHAANSKTGEQIGPYEAARALRPDNPTVWSNLGVALANRGDFAGELAAVREAVRLDPLEATARNNLAVALRGRGDLNGAVREFKVALRLNPEFAVPYDGLGIIQALKDDRDGAIELFREAVRLDPNFARAHNNLGKALGDSGDPAEAIASYKRAIEADDGYAMAWGNLGAMLQRKGDPEGALRAFREAVRLDPRFALAHSNLGALLEATGDLDGALEAFREAARADPKMASAHCSLASLYRKRKRYPESVESARAAIRADPKLADGYGHLGLALQGLGDIPGARAALTEAERLNAKRWSGALAALPPLELAPPPHEKE
jgi:tetratricopeptide (TPR) repeat protein